MLPKAFEDGVFTVKDPGLPGMWKREDGYGGGNIGHVFGVDGTDAESITKGIIDARKRMTEYRTYYRGYLEGYENTELIASGSVLGIRESRRIKCDYMANIDDYFNQADFEDEIGRYSYPVDIHPMAGTQAGMDGFAKSVSIRHKAGETYSIPYRSLVPKGLDNVFVAGRCIGADRARHFARYRGCAHRRGQRRAHTRRSQDSRLACADIRVWRIDPRESDTTRSVRGSPSKRRWCECRRRQKC
jgi:hypothetical protein